MADNIKDLITYPETIEITVQSISKGVRDVYAEEQIIDTVIKFEAHIDKYRFIQTEDLTEAGIAVHPYGAIIVPDTANAENAVLEVEYNGVSYSISNVNFNDLEVGDTFEVSESGEVMPEKSSGMTLYGPYIAWNKSNVSIASGESEHVSLGQTTQSGDLYFMDVNYNNCAVDLQALYDDNAKFILFGYQGYDVSGVEVKQVMNPLDNLSDTFAQPYLVLRNTSDSSVSVPAGRVGIWLYCDHELPVME